ncbi:MAG TPA: hypothetical protein VEX70_05050 [Pyrinomonadaceae bacterium]|nr:hypothetical protein [Pyrinomonadaceae bacterium]
MGTSQPGFVFKDLRLGRGYDFRRLFNLLRGADTRQLSRAYQPITDEQRRGHGQSASDCAEFDPF